jgi:hypothetical protein
MKKCSDCKESLTKNNASQSVRISGGYCRPCKAVRQRKRYSKNYVRTNRRVSFPNDPWEVIDPKKYPHPDGIGTKRRLYRNHFFANNPCVDCGNTDIRVLTLDHVRGKKKGNPATFWLGETIQTIRKEIKKCEVVCHNCHAIRTEQRQGGWVTSIPDELNEQMVLLDRDLDLAA